MKPTRDLAFVGIDDRLLATNKEALVAVVRFAKANQIEDGNIWLTVQCALFMAGVDDQSDYYQEAYKVVFPGAGPAAGYPPIWAELGPPDLEFGP